MDAESKSQALASDVLGGRAGGAKREGEKIDRLLFIWTTSRCNCAFSRGCGMSGG